MRKVFWTGVVALAVMIIVCGCNSNGNGITGSADPSDSSDAIGKINGIVAGTPGDLYTAYNEDS